MKLLIVISIALMCVSWAYNCGRQDQSNYISSPKGFNSIMKDAGLSQAQIKMLHREMGE